jgi:hypothetical protein
MCALPLLSGVAGRMWRVGEDAVLHWRADPWLPRQHQHRRRRPLRQFIGPPPRGHPP